MEVDLDQAITNLLRVVPRDQLLREFELSPTELLNLPRMFAVGTRVLDKHLDLLPKEHTKTLLLVGESNTGIHRKNMPEL